MAETPKAAVLPRVESSDVLFTKLRPGPGRSAAEVAEHQKARIETAMVELAVDRGYDAVTVRELSGRAKVSTRAFYKLFSDKESCLLQAHESVVRSAVKRVIAAQIGECDWEERLRLAFEAFVEHVENEPLATRLALFEIYRAGPAAVEQARRAERTFEAMLAESFAYAPDGIEVPPLLAEGMVSGIAQVIRSRALSGGDTDLTDLGNELLAWVLARRSSVSAVEEGAVSLPVSSSTAGEGSRSRASMADRDLILTATAKLIAAEGYEQLSISRIRATAGVSRQRFNVCFDGVEDCFFAAVEQRTEAAIAQAEQARTAGNNELEAIHKVVVTLCKQVACEPALAKLCFTEVFLPGSQGLKFSVRITNSIASLVSEQPSSGEQSPAVLDEATGGMIWGLISHRSLAGYVGSLPRIAPDLANFVTMPGRQMDRALEAA